MHFNHPAGTLGWAVSEPAKPLQPSVLGQIQPNPSLWSLLHHHSHLLCSPLLGSSLVSCSIALDSVGQTGVRDGLQMDSRSLWRSAGTGFDPGSDLGLQVQLWEGSRASMAFSGHCFTGRCQKFLSLNFIYKKIICHLG